MSSDRATERPATSPPPGQGVCVLIAAHNAQSTIGRAAGSALAEPLVTEVVVVDDASTDATEAAAQGADDGSGRLRVLRLLRNRGPAAARNLALAASSAPLVALLDADDYFLPGRIATLLGDASDNWDLLADNIVIVPEALAGLPVDIAQGARASSPQRLGLEDFVLGNISERTRHRGELGFLKPIMRRSFLDRAGLRYDERMRLGEDYALYVQALAAGARFLLSRQAGYVAIERPDSISARHGTDDLRRIAEFDTWCLDSLGSLTAAERSALNAHRAATRRKVAHGEVLDARRRSGYPAALGVLARRPLALAHIARETLRARLPGLWPRWSADQRKTPPAARLLIDAAGSDARLPGGGARAW